MTVSNMPASSARPGRKGSRAYLGAFLISPVAALLRNVAIARLLGVDMYGLAVTLVVTGTFIDTITDTGGDKFIVQHSDGDDPRLLDTAHAVMVSRGVIAAILLAALSWPLSSFYRQPQLAPALALLGLVPLINAFKHLDVRRLQRQRDFRAESRIMVASEVISLIVAAATAYLLRDFYAALWALLARAVVGLIMSHAVAERPYRLRYDPATVRSMWSFGWPLLLNGGLVFLGGQGDRLVIGHFLDPRALGLYSTTLLLIFYPTSIVQRFLSGIYFPEIAAARDRPEELNRWEARLRGQLLLAAVVGSIGFTIVAPFVLVHVYGRNYAQAPILVGLIGLLQTIRMLRIWPATMAIGLGRTGNILMGNILRLAAIPLAIWGVSKGYGLAGLAMGFLLGELFAIAGAQMLLSRTQKRPVFTGFGTILMMLLTGLLVTLIGRMMSGGPNESVTIIATVVVAGLVLAACLADKSVVAAAREALQMAKRQIVRAR